jgi:hypothetical protein
MADMGNLYTQCAVPRENGCKRAWLRPAQLAIKSLYQRGR